MTELCHESFPREQQILPVERDEDQYGANGQRCDDSDIRPRIVSSGPRQGKHGKTHAEEEQQLVAEVDRS